MKKQSFIKHLALAIIILAGQTLYAKQYCGEVLTSGDKSITLTCQSKGGDVYEMLIEGEGITGLGGCFMNVNGVGTIMNTSSDNLIFDLASDGTYVKLTITSTTAPNVYTPLYVMMPGEANFGEITDIEWGTCAPPAADNVKPAMVSATVDSYDHSSAIISVVATDKNDEEGDTQVSTFLVSDAGNSIDNVEYTASEGKITVNLTPETTYNLSIKAKDGSGNISDNAIAVDKFTTPICLTEPTTAAPAAGTTYPANQVLAIFSDVYTTVNVTNFNPGWGQATQQSIVQIAGDNTLKYANLNYQGTEFTDINASEMEKLHLNVWVAENTSINIFPICRVQPTGEQFVTANLVGGQWNSVEINVADYVSKGLDMSGVFQFKITGSGNVWIDNWYFYTTQAPQADTTAPVMTTAVVSGDPTCNSVVLEVAATDKDNSNNDKDVTKFIVSDVANELAEQTLTATDGKITIEGLKGSTAYNVLVKAKDAKDNISATGISVAFTTDAAPIYNNLPTGHLGNPEFGDPNGRILLTIAKESETSISISMVSNNPTPGAIMKIVANIAGRDYTLGDGSADVTGAKLMIEGLANVESITFNYIQWNTGGPGMWTVSDKAFTITEDQLYVAGSGTSVETATTMPRIYPNPVTDVMYVCAESRINQLSIYNLQGQSIRTEAVGADSAAIHVGELSEGAYFVTIVTEDGKNHTQKMIKK